MSEESFCIADLVRHFEEHLQSKEQVQIMDQNGQVPQFPLLVIFYGGKAISRFPEVGKRLYQIWPQFLNELLFLGVRETAEHSENLVFFELTMNRNLCMTNNFFFFSFSFTGMNSKVDLLC